MKIYQDCPNVFRFFFKFPHLKGFVTEDILLSEALFLLLTVVICKLLLKKPIHATS